RAGGIAATQRPSRGQDPASTISSPDTRKAPTAALKPPSTAPVVARSAPPGVDQATLIGSRVRRLTQIAHRPMDMDSAISPDAARAWLGPTALRPWARTATAGAKPRQADSRPADTARRELSCSLGGAEALRIRQTPGSPDPP